MRKLTLLFLCTTLSCSSGMSRALRHDMAPGETAVIDNEAIAKALAARPQLPKPFSVAVVFEEVGWPRNWAASQKEAILSLETELQKTGEVAAFFALPQEFVRANYSAESKEDHLLQTRLAAAKMGADALLLVSLDDNIDNSTNAWAFTYPFVVTMLFVPGNTVSGSVAARATLVDVRNGFVYMTAAVDKDVHKLRPALFSSSERFATAARESAMVELRSEVYRRTQQMAKH